jgi:hypothetical protein
MLEAKPDPSHHHPSLDARPQRPPPKARPQSPAPPKPAPLPPSLAEEGHRRGRPGRERGGLRGGGGGGGKAQEKGGQEEGACGGAWGTTDPVRAPPRAVNARSTARRKGPDGRSMGRAMKGQCGSVSWGHGSTGAAAQAPLFPLPPRPKPGVPRAVRTDASRRAPIRPRGRRASAAADDRPGARRRRMTDARRGASTAARALTSRLLGPLQNEARSCPACRAPLGRMPLGRAPPRAR